MGNAIPVTPAPQGIYPGKPARQLNPGDIIEQPNSCAPLLSSPNVCYPNGEFVAQSVKRVTSCCYVTGGQNEGTEFKGGTCAGCDRESNCLLLGGGPVPCQFLRYNADPYECALTGVDPQDRGDGIVYTCDPRVLPGGDMNLSTIKTYCSIKANFFNDNRCFEFCTQNNCTALVQDFCRGDDLRTDACKNYCFSTQSDYDCATQLVNYCAQPENQEADICPCFLPLEFYKKYYQNLLGDKVVDPAGVIATVARIPYCSYVPCSSSQFQPREQDPCPDTATCVNAVVINANGDITFEGNIETQQRCQAILGTSVNSGPIPTGPGFPDWAIAVIVIGIILFIIAIVLIAVYAGKKPKEKTGL